MYDERIAGSRADALGPRLQRLDLSGVGGGEAALWGLIRRAVVCRPGVIQAWVSAFIYLSIYLSIYRIYLPYLSIYFSRFDPRPNRRGAGVTIKVLYVTTLRPDHI